MYCTSWCPGCRRARAYFQENGIPFVEIDITRDREAAARVRGWANGNETTPTFDIRGQIIVDYDLAKIEAALGIKR
jgi:glutaredoxin